MSTTEAEVATKLTVREMAGTLTGFDELAIEQRFGHEITDLSDTRVVRALVFVQLRRGGMDDKAAYGEVMRRAFVEIKGEFLIEDEGEAAGEG